MFQRRIAVAVFAPTLLAAGAHAASFIISNPGTNSTTAVGQNFSPFAEPNPDPTLALTDTVFLSSFTFTKGFNPDGNASTRLVVLPGAYYDTNGGDGTFVPTIADVAGISTNSLDTTGATAFGAPLTFTFNNLPLVYGNNYAVAFATVGANDALTFISVNIQYINYVESPIGSGIFIPVTNYGGAGNFNRAALFADFDGNGFFEGDNNAADLNFTGTFETVLTIPGDYNADGFVDAADYTVWADNFGQNFPAADGNGDGVVDAADYTIWADNFGQGTPPGGIAAGSIPEPASIALLSLTLLTLRRRR